ncbi:MAG: TRAP transporter fused permease subunit [Desulfarculaceae bacterium]|nr:TRAP transporter fused permease subunit [Desulfarculaceae bacterium]MCF8071187.1 TRAP transporter fused permease subunit [Desulfarculaceae bacterium]MCF8101210.1 TRAP transporter fused permease subunit [Desulfarculaceae bacterium]MCF8115241.1 TRAP transporter fused permease subunit [Desulfarculaceae bacterium]
MNRSIGIAADLLCAGLAVFAVVVAAIGVFDMVVVSGLTVLLGLLVCVFRLEQGKSQQAANPPRLALHGLMALALVYIFWEWGLVMFEQEINIIDISLWRNAFAWVSIALISYLSYRFFGIPMLAVLALSAAYLLLPPAIGGSGVGWKHAMENLWFSTDGVFGRPVEVVSRTVLVFIVFGAVLQQSGAGAVLLRIAMAATGRFAGGPAHAAVAASALFGSLSGTAVANVVSTGVFTIPIIKKIGFKPAFAGAVEAAASTGGQIMPPVMGVVAFLMADITGIPYLKIIVAALIPSIMYYSSLFIVVFIEAKRLGVAALPRDQRIKLTRDDMIKSLALVVPLGVIIAVLITGRTAQNAGFYALISAFVLCLLLFPDFRHPAKWWRALVDSGKTCAVLMVIVSAIGFVIGVINMTGIGLMFAEAVLSVASSDLWLALIFVMLSCLVMGMGVPTGAAYLMIAIVLGPVLHKLGLSLMAAHLFVVYFGVLSVVTPPVALAAFAAAPIADANPMETGLQATRLSIAGFIIPYLFVFHPDILLVVGEFNFVGLLWALFVFFVSTWGIATGLGGWEWNKLPLWQRAARLLSAVLLIVPGVPSGLAGGVLLAVCLVLNLRSRRGPQYSSVHQ